MKNNKLKSLLIATYCAVTVLCIEAQGADSLNKEIEHRIVKVNKNFIIEEKDLTLKFVENVKSKTYIEFTANKISITNQPMNIELLEFLFGKKIIIL
jgi:hypothetical protein